MGIQKVGFWVLLVVALVVGGLSIGASVLADDHTKIYLGSISEDQKACFQEEAGKSWIKSVELYPSDKEEYSSSCSACRKVYPTDFKVVTVNERYEFPYGDSSASSTALQLLCVLSASFSLGAVLALGFARSIDWI